MVCAPYLPYLHTPSFAVSMDSFYYLLIWRETYSCVYSQSLASIKKDKEAFVIVLLSEDHKVIQ